MSYLFITADEIGIETGGGVVTKNECQALFNLAASHNLNAFAWQRATLSTFSTIEDKDPWVQDECALRKLQSSPTFKPELVHFYSGTFSKTVKYLKEKGCKISYTIAAHDKAISWREHRRWGLPFPYTHLTNDTLWKQYIEGYRLADVIICPSTVAKKTVQEYGPDFANKRIEVVPHGCELPEKVAPLPKTFTAGYLGSWGPDKGTIYLLQAWKQLNYKDAVLLLGGSPTSQPWAWPFVAQHGGGNIVLTGWQKSVSDFYNKLSLYIQPSATEGFGLEVLEALAHNRPVLCSTAAGAKDIVPELWQFEPCSIDKLASKIDYFRRNWAPSSGIAELERLYAQDYTWDKIRTQYMDVWRSML